MVKQLHLIIYQPGYAGMFLQCLFSLDSSTVPHASVDSNRDTVYSFSNATSYSSWREFHEQYSDKNTAKILDLPRGYDHMVYSVHPLEFFELNLSTFENVNYYVADLPTDDFCNFWLVRTKEKWGGFPILRPQEVCVERKIRKEYPVTSIAIDKILDKNTWEDEYLRVTELMRIPHQLERARVLYKDWYNLRVAPLIEEFSKSTTSTVTTYSQRRQQAELNSEQGIESWIDFYNFRRGVDWPDCPNEHDFYLLPDFIKHELINYFGYKPK